MMSIPRPPEVSIYAVGEGCRTCGVPLEYWGGDITGLGIDEDDPEAEDEPEENPIPFLGGSLKNSDGVNASGLL